VPSQQTYQQNQVTKTLQKHKIKVKSTPTTKQVPFYFLPFPFAVQRACYRNRMCTQNTTVSKKMRVEGKKKS
jgi:hypothetical protein